MIKIARGLFASVTVHIGQSLKSCYLTPNKPQIWNSITFSYLQVLSDNLVNNILYTVSETSARHMPDIKFHLKQEGVLFFSQPRAGLTNWVHIQDSWAGAPLIFSAHHLHTFSFLMLVMRMGFKTHVGLWVWVWWVWVWVRSLSPTKTHTHSCGYFSEFP